MNNDEIVADVISLIHSTTRSNYVLCSQVSAKIFAYLAQIPTDENRMHELIAAVERFDHHVDHPDLQQFRQLLKTISDCANDCEERNYTLGRDRSLLVDSINSLRDLLKSHVDLRCALLAKVIEQQEIRSHLIDLMNLTGMNVGNEVHGVLCEIVYLLCHIDRTLAATTVIDHPILVNCQRIIQTSVNQMYSKEDHSTASVLSALNLLSKLLSTNEPLPVHTSSQLSNGAFLRSIFELVENQRDDDALVSASIRFLLSFNLVFDYPHENPLVLTLLEINEDTSTRELIERLILLFNRGVDPTGHPTTNSIIKFFADVLDDQTRTADSLLSDSDRHLVIEIISRELSNRACSDQSTTAYLSLLELLLRHRTITPDTCRRVDELRATFHTHLSTETCLPENRFIIDEIARQHPWILAEGSD